MILNEEHRDCSEHEANQGRELYHVKVPYHVMRWLELLISSLHANVHWVIYLTAVAYRQRCRKRTGELGNGTFSLCTSTASF